MIFDVIVTKPVVFQVRADSEEEAKKIIHEMLSLSVILVASPKAETPDIELVRRP